MTHQIRRIQKTLTGRVLTSELDSGSRAAQETDDGFTQNLLESDLTFCEAGINHIVDCLLAVNGLDPDGVYFAFERKKGIDKSRWERDVALINSGAITFTAQYYLDNYGLEAQHFTVNEKAEARMSLAAALPVTSPPARRKLRTVCSARLPPCLPVLMRMPLRRPSTQQVMRPT